MKKFLFLTVLSFFTFGYVQPERVFLPRTTVLAQNIDSATVLKNAYNNRQSNIQVRGEGESLRYYVQFPKDDKSIIFADDDPDFEVNYLDESATVEELIQLNKQSTSKKVDHE